RGAVGDAGGGEDDAVARREILRAVDLLRIGDPHRAAALLVLRLLDHQPGVDLAVQAAHRGGGQHAFGGAAGAHHRVDAGADDGRGDACRQVAVADQPDARAGRANVRNQLFVPRPVEHDDDQVVDTALEAPGDRLEVFLDGGV